MSHDVIVVGAGIVGVSIAIHLLRRGRSVVILDRREPGKETSFGNAGIIQREGVRPHTFPRDLAMLLKVGLHLSTAARYNPLSLHRFAPPLLRYWWHSAPSRYRLVVESYAPLIARSIEEHADLIAASGAEDLIIRKGWLLAFRTRGKLEAELARVRSDHELYGIGYEALDAAALSALEPNLKRAMAGAIRWTDPWTVRNPGALVAAYARLAESLGATFVKTEMEALEPEANGWTARTRQGPIRAKQAVIALGPWAPQTLEPLGYRLPLFVKRGYHMHYANKDGEALSNWLLDAEIGYMLAPMQKGIRLTTGAEFSPRDNPPTPVQLHRAEAAARGLVDLGERLDPEPWMGARPCTPDMMPIIGPAPRHEGLFLAIGHAHHGFTLGPATGRALAEAMTGEEPMIDITPFRADRF